MPLKQILDHNGIFNLLKILHYFWTVFTTLSAYFKTNHKIIKRNVNYQNVIFCVSFERKDCTSVPHFTI